MHLGPLQDVGVATGHDMSGSAQRAAEGVGSHLSMEDEMPLRPKVRAPRQSGWGWEASERLEDRASRPAVERGIGVQSSTSALLPSLAVSASKNLQRQFIP